MKFRSISPQGVNYDVPAYLLEDSHYSSALNMSFRRGAAETVKGYAEVWRDDTKNVLYLLGNRRPGTFYWIMPSDTGVYVTDQSSAFDITPTGYDAGSDTDWTGVEVNGIAIINNGITEPWWWDGKTTNAMQPFSGWELGTTAGFIAGFKNFCIAGNITSNDVNFENQLDWSASVAAGLPPDDWLPVPSNDAGDAILADVSGSLVDGAALHDQLVLAKHHALYLMAYVGGQFVFSFRKLSDSRGVLSTDCMVEHSGLLYIFSDGDLIVTDGSTVQSIATDVVRDAVFKVLDTTRYKLCHVALHQGRDEVWFLFPSSGNRYCNKAAVYTVTSKSWTVRDVPDVLVARPGLYFSSNDSIAWNDDGSGWDGDGTGWDSGIISEIDDSVVMGSQHSINVAGAALDFGGAAIPTVLEKASMDFGDPVTVKNLLQVWLTTEGRPGDVLTVRCGGQMARGDDILWGIDHTFIIGSDDYIEVDVTGRFLSIRVESALNSPIQVGGIKFGYEDAGLW